MPPAEGTMELDLTIHASGLPAPSLRFTGIEVGPANSPLGFEDPGRCAVSLTNVCDNSDFQDCTAPWICG